MIDFILSVIAAAKSSPVPSASPRLSPYSMRRATRPARLSAVPRTLRRLDEPVSTNRPGRRSASIAAFTARVSSGIRWISSITNCRSPAWVTNPHGSAIAAARVCS